MTGPDIGSESVAFRDVKTAISVGDMDKDHSVARRGGEPVDVRDHPGALRSDHDLGDVVTDLDVGLGATQPRREPAQQRLGDSEMTPRLMRLMM